MAYGLYDGSLESIPGLGGYLQQQKLTNQQDLSNLQKAQAVGGIVQQQQSMADAQKVRAVLSQGGEPGAVIQSLVQAGPTGIDAAQKYMGVLQAQNFVKSMQGGGGMNMTDPNSLRTMAATMAAAGRPEAAVFSGLADHLDAKQANAAELTGMQDQTAPITSTPNFGLGAPGTAAAGVGAFRANVAPGGPMAVAGTPGYVPAKAGDANAITMQAPVSGNAIPQIVLDAINKLKPGQPFSISDAAQPPETAQKTGGIYSTLMQSPDPAIAAAATTRQQQLDSITNPATFNPQTAMSAVNQLQTQEGQRDLQKTLAGTKNEITIRGQDLGLQGREEMVGARMAALGLNLDGTLSAAGEANAQAAAEGKIALANLPEPVRARALAINPNASQGGYLASVGTEKNVLQATQPFNAATLHLAQLSQLADALNNGDMQLVNGIGNKIATWSGGVAPTNFDALKSIVGQEVTKAIVANGGSAGERDEASKTIASFSSPAQLAGVINTYQNAMGAQLLAIAQRYKAGNGQKDFSSFLLPDAQRAYQAELQAHPGALSGQAPAASPTAPKIPNGRVQVLDGKPYVFMNGQWMAQ